MNFTVYKNDTGEIVKNCVCPAEFANDQIVAGESIIEGVSSDITQYVVNGVVTDKPAMTPIVNGLTITGLPIPCSLTTYGTTYEIPDGEVTLSYDLAGEYHVKVVAFPYLNWEVTVDAN